MTEAHIQQIYNIEAKERGLRAKATSVTLQHKNGNVYDADISLSDAQKVRWEVSSDGKEVQLLKQQFPVEKASPKRKVGKTAKAGQ